MILAIAACASDHGVIRAKQLNASDDLANRRSGVSVLREAQNYLLTGRWEEAISAADGAIASGDLTPDQVAEAHYLSGYAYWGLKKYDLAARQLEFALKQRPHFTKAADLLVDVLAKTRSRTPDIRRQLPAEDRQPKQPSRPPIVQF